MWRCREGALGIYSFVFGYPCDTLSASFVYPNVCLRSQSFLRRCALSNDIFVDSCPHFLSFLLAVLSAHAQYYYYVIACLIFDTEVILPLREFSIVLSCQFLIINNSSSPQHQVLNSQSALTGQTPSCASRSRIHKCAGKLVDCAR